ncbi:MAG: hypothetical protein Q8K58_02710, partial [Acidimicrobiales bacterium]|nr:hypothetical protein [Acidimicrobiales bacterium]
MVSRRIFDSVDELLAGATRREPFAPAVRRSTAGFERAWIDGEPHIVKYLHADDDFAMRAYGDLGSRTLLAYGAGLFDAAAEVIDHAVVGMARGVGRNGWGCAVLMRDVTGDLATTDDRPFGGEQHERFVDHLAGMCASTWGWRDDLGLLPYGTRWVLMGPATIAAELASPSPEPVVPIVSDGLARLEQLAPRDVCAGIRELQRDIGVLADALAATPSCFLHGDWKASNLGTAEDGRTVLIDWVYLGEGPGC